MKISEPRNVRAYNQDQMVLFPPSVQSLIEADDLCRVVNDGDAVFPNRCEKAGIPESQRVFRTKDELVLEIVEDPEPYIPEKRNKRDPQFTRYRTDAKSYEVKEVVELFKLSDQPVLKLRRTSTEKAGMDIVFGY